MPIFSADVAYVRFWETKTVVEVFPSTAVELLLVYGEGAGADSLFRESRASQVGDPFPSHGDRDSLVSRTGLSPDALICLIFPLYFFSSLEKE